MPPDIWGMPSPMFHLDDDVMRSHFGASQRCHYWEYSKIAGSCLLPADYKYPAENVTGFGQLVGRVAAVLASTDDTRGDLCTTILRGWSAYYVSVFMKGYAKQFESDSASMV